MHQLQYNGKQAKAQGSLNQNEETLPSAATLNDILRVENPYYVLAVGVTRPSLGVRLGKFGQ